MLVEAARRLRENMRGVDLVARIGGEEFLIVMPGTPLAEARVAASRLCRRIADEGFAVPGSESLIHVTVSIGLTMGGQRDLKGRNTCDMDPNRLLDAADKALYEAKLQGRNQINLNRPAA